MKKIFGAIAIIVLLLGGYSTYKAQSETSIPKMALVNIEALANSSDAPIYGESTIKGNCEIISVVYRPECHVKCICQRIWYPSPRIANAKAYNVSGFCECGNYRWDAYNIKQTK